MFVILFATFRKRKFFKTQRKDATIENNTSTELQNQTKNAENVQEKQDQSSSTTGNEYAVFDLTTATKMNEMKETKESQLGNQYAVLDAATTKKIQSQD